jgi:hypothetical protein
VIRVDPQASDGIEPERLPRAEALRTHFAADA